MKARVFYSLFVASVFFLLSAQSYTQESRQTLSHHVRPAVTSGQAKPAGVLSGTEQMNLSIVLSLRNRAQLTSLLRNLYDPSSTDYHHFVSVEDFADRFGPTAEDYQKVVDFAGTNGFEVHTASANRMTVSLTGSVAQVEKAFGVKMQRYQHPTEAREFFSPDREPSVPLNLKVAHIAGLTNFSVPRPLLAKAASSVLPLDNSALSGSGPGGVFLSSDMRAAYYGGTTLTGKGQTVGLVEFNGYNVSDVDLTFSSAGQSYSVPINNVLTGGATGGACQFGPYQFGDPCSDAEEVTDIVQAIGMAPGLSQVRVYIGYLDSEILSAVAAENIAKQVSISWGWTPEDPSIADVFFQEMAAQGQSVFVASGDSGNYSTGDYPYPGEDAYVTTVGGTDLVTSGAGGAWSSETAWSQSGGGISPDGIAIPSWQTGVANASNGGSATLRNVPDVAMEANIDNYYCDWGECNIYVLGGTSLAAPRWAAFVALVNQQATEAGEPTVGFLNPAIYGIGAGANYASDLHDITSGSNNYSNLCNGAAACNAVPGYDLVTGWGSPTGQALIDALAPPASAGFQISTSVTSLSINPGSSGTTTIAVTGLGGFNGSVNLAVSGLPGGVTPAWGTNPTSGNSVLTLTVSSATGRGSYPVTVTGISGSLSATTDFTLAINAPGFAIFPSPGALQLQRGLSIATTIEVVKYAGFGGNVDLAITSSLPDGVTASWSEDPASSASMLVLSASDTAVLTESPSFNQVEDIPITIRGTSGSQSASTVVTLSLMNSGIWAAVSPTFLPINQGASGTATFTAVPYGKTHGTYMLSVGPLPSGVTVSFDPVFISAGETSQISFTTDATTPLGLGGVMINAVAQQSGEGSSSTGLPLIVTATPQPSASVSISPVYAVLQPGSSTTVNISVNGQNGFTGPEYLRVVPPPGVTSSFSQDPTSSTSILTLTASASAQPGLWNPDLCYSTDANACVSGSATPSYSNDFWVQVQPTASFSLTSSARSLSAVPGGSATSTISVAPQAGVTGNVQLSVVSTLPPGLTASFSPNSTSTNSVLTLTAATSVPPGKYLVMIAGTSGSQTNTSTIELNIANATTTKLSITPASDGTSYALGSPLTLTATVLSGSAPVIQGQVNVCDASSAYCTDSHLLGTAQLTPAGTATLKFHPGIGSHSYKAVFVGTPSGSPPFETSTSSNSTFVVSGPTSTAISATGEPGNYTLTATVAGAGSTTAPTGTVSFVDTSNGNAILGTAPVAPGSGSLIFTNSSNSITGKGPQSVATGDFNGDGILDMAVTNSLGNTVTILLGNGDGTFTATQNSPATGNKPMGVVAGDFNGDGILDLAVANSLGNTVTILLGNGDGTFTAAADSPNTGSSPTYIAAGDFNGDGKLDLAVVNSTGSGSSMTILLGNGDGTFTAMPDSPANGYALGAVVVGDFNRDGNLDLAVEDQTGTLMILLGRGDGTFNFFWNTPNQPFVYGAQNLVSADFNGDGNLDLAVVNTNENTVSILLGNGDGTFTATPNSSATGASPNSIAVGDFNGDGNLDLAISVAGGDVTPITILLGNGDGTFAAAQNIPPRATCPISVAAGDWNGDGVSDLVIVNGCGNLLTAFTTSLTETATASVSEIAVTGSGTHAAVATYPGDSLYGASTSGTTSLSGENPAVAPTFSISAGSYTSVQTVSLSDTTPGAVIYYTTNGSTPKAGSTLYSSPITVSATETIQSVAIASGYSPSAVNSATYTINLPAAAPAFSVAQGTYASVQTVSLSDTTPGAVIYFTTNGTTPTASSTPYSGPITVSATETIQAVAIASGYSLSAVNSATYTINLANPAPAITSTAPAYSVAGNPAFTLTVNGNGFIAGSTVYWGSSALSTQFVSTTQLTALVPASGIASAGITAITVETPAPGGGTSGTLQFEVDSAGTSSSASPTFTATSASVPAGNTATYPVTLSSSVSNVTVSCLNLPPGATCSYSSSSGAVSIATSTSTPAGNYQVTAVFTETQTLSAGYLLAPFLLLPLMFLRRKLAANRAWITVCLVVGLALGAIMATGCGGGGSTSQPVQSNPTTHQVTSSGVITLTIK